MKEYLFWYKENGIKKSIYISSTDKLTAVDKFNLQVPNGNIISYAPVMD